MTPHPRVDFKKRYRQLYKPSCKAFSIVEVPPLRAQWRDEADGRVVGRL